ncbi:MAG: hypothetical protein ACJ754_21215 [Pyrinomonadaceae bacterium]
MNYFLLDVTGDVIYLVVLIVVLILVALGLIFGVYKLVDRWDERKHVKGFVSPDPVVFLPNTSGGGDESQRGSGGRGAGRDSGGAREHGSSRGRGVKQSFPPAESFEPVRAGDENRMFAAQAQNPQGLANQGAMLQEILFELRRIRNLLAEQRAERLGGDLDVPPQFAARAVQPRSSPSSVENFRKLYNAAVDDDERRSDFRRQFNFVQVGTRNFIERRQKINLEPEFREANDGEYYVAQLDDGRNNYYAVVPKFDLTFQESSYGPGAMGLVFNCPSYNSRLRYRSVKVIRPARFEKRGSQWFLAEQGELDLGTGEQ